jgi:hypothetical protein
MYGQARIGVGGFDLKQFNLLTCVKHGAKIRRFSISPNFFPKSCHIFFKLISIKPIFTPIIPKTYLPRKMVIKTAI